MTPLEFRPASNWSPEELAALFTRGYEGYYTPVAVGTADFETMAHTGDFDLGASCVGLESGMPVAFAMLGVRELRGWVGGMGVVAESRGRGYGRQVMERVIRAARERAVRQLDLEVLEHNVQAAPIYEALGFRDRRWLDVWVRPPGPIGSLPASQAEAEELVAEPPLDECLALYARFHPERPPWQRDEGSLRRWGARLSVIGVRDASGIRGWVIYREAGSRLTLADLAVAPGTDLKPVAKALAALIAARPESAILLVNLPPSDAFAPVLRELGAEVKLRQREMTLALA
ncbi:MAG: GNAT family N-acetyltransferase [Candidatus Eiseniibacteriota bacterium]